MIPKSKEVNVSSEMRPQTVNIFSKEYQIIYCKKPSDVDAAGHQSLWGQVDHWAHLIRIYAPKNFSSGEVWDSILHEVMHAIVHELKLKISDEGEQVSLLAMGLADVLLRNEWLKNA